jgi:hypothetical protein
MASRKQAKRGKRIVSAAAARLRHTLVENLSALIDARYPQAKYQTVSAAQRRFAQDARVSWSTVQRWLNPENGMTLDVLADIASALESKASDLLTAGFDQTIARTVDGIRPSTDELYRDRRAEDPDAAPPAGARRK